MENLFITDTVKYIGVNDKDIDLFENQYIVKNGVSYNSYLILDEKTCVMDTVDAHKTKEWLDNLGQALEGRTPDYLVISHLEPDHSGSIDAFVEAYPDITLVSNAKCFSMLSQFCDKAPQAERITVAENDTLSLGEHELRFIMAPMVHWPEVMVEYEAKDKILFSADAFGKFGALDCNEEWTDEARRYYINIVGKYGALVNALLKKAEGLEISHICPLHGPVISENIGYCVNKYKVWASYEPEEKGVVIACASIHGNTAQAALKLGEILREKGEQNVVIYDLSRDDIASVVSDAFRYDRLVTMCSTYDGGIFPCMESFLCRLKSKAYQKRRVATVENGSWAPSANKKMQEYFSQMQNITLSATQVSIRSVLKEQDIEGLEALADELLS